MSTFNPNKMFFLSFPSLASPLDIEKDNQLHKDKHSAINLEEMDFAEMDPSTSKIDPDNMDSSTSKIDPEEMDPSTSKIDSVSSHEVPNETTSAPTNVNRPSLMESSSPVRSHEVRIRMSICIFLFRFPLAFKKETGCSFWGVSSLNISNASAFIPFFYLQFCSNHFLFGYISSD